MDIFSSKNISIVWRREDMSIHFFLEQDW